MAKAETLPVKCPETVALFTTYANLARRIDRHSGWAVTRRKGRAPHLRQGTIASVDGARGTIVWLNVGHIDKFHRPPSAARAPVRAFLGLVDGNRHRPWCADRWLRRAAACEQ